MRKRLGGKIKLGPAWWIAYGVLCGFGAAGLILLLVAPRRGKPIELLPVPTPNPLDTQIAVVTATPAPLPTSIFPININTATIQDLQQLPNVGPTLAQAIINYRDSHGPFTDISQIQNVAGIGPKTFDALRTLITIGTP